MSHTNLKYAYPSPELQQELIKGGVKGMRNMSNTCYMNSAIQALLHTYPLILLFWDADYEEDVNPDKEQQFLINVVKDLVDKYWKNQKHNAVIVPSRFHNIVNMLASERGITLFQIGRQNDTQEFITLVIDSLHEALSYPITANITGKMTSKIDQYILEGYKQFATFYRKNYSPIIDIFYGQFHSSITCNTCGHESSNFPPECVFALPVRKTGGQITLYDCWNNFTQPEILKGDNMFTCEKCKVKREMTKKMAIWKLPQVMIILLKRFEIRGNQSLKIDNLVDIPMTLNMEDYCESHDRFNASYDLYGVCNHSGGTGGGHYYAYCKGPDDKWRNFNDSQVSEMRESEVIKRTAYCLFYRRKKLPGQ